MAALGSYNRRSGRGGATDSVKWPGAECWEGPITVLCARIKILIATRSFMRKTAKSSLAGFKNPRHPRSVYHTRLMRSREYALQGILTVLVPYGLAPGGPQTGVSSDVEMSPSRSAVVLAAQLEIAALTGLLRQFGPQLRRQHCDTLNGSKHTNMKELRFTLPDGEWRIAFAFDPQRQAILLVGGSKSGTNERQFYRDLIRVADERFSAHLARLRSQKTEGK